MRALRLATWLLVGVALCGAGQRPPDMGDVSDVRLFRHPTHTRVVVELTREAAYTEHRLEVGDGKPRLYLDIDGIWAGPDKPGPTTAAGIEPAVAVRTGQNTLRTARVVLDLDRHGRRFRTFHLRDPFRIVVDVFDDEAPVSAAPSPSARGFDERPVRRVVIDPGHGGKDPGASARRGPREKDVVLRVAREVGRLLRDAGLEVHLTRDSDRYLTLEQRTTIANHLDADVFVSIHANASPNRGTRGVETYLLDTRYDRQTARVAARENGTTIEALGEVQKILAALRLGYNERFAARLAERVHTSLHARLRRARSETRDLGVKRGPFIVLFTANMPAILVEVGFLSNRSEAKWLGSREYARTAAAGIAQGVLAYRDEHARSLVAGR